MAVYTYQTMSLYEVRVLELTIIDQDGNAFAPDNVYYTIENSSGTELVSSTLAAMNSNVIFADVDTTITATVGTYKVIWKITKNSKIYYHVTQITVDTL